MLLSREKVTAISHLRVVANWSGSSARSESASAVYNPPPGFVVISTETIVHNSNNGGREVSVMAGGLNLTVETELHKVYDSALDLAGALNDNQLKGRLEYKRNEHVRELRRYQSSHNTVFAVVRARAHGHVLDRKRGWEEISVTAELLNLGTPDKQDLAAALEAEFGIDIPDDFRKLPPNSATVPVFDPDFYLMSHGDLQIAFGSDLVAARDHWLKYGISEGRRSSPAFDVRYYMDSHLDLQKAFGANNYASATEHWLKHGIKEGRKSSIVFDVRHYLNSYSDLQTASGATNYVAAVDHWLNHGVVEGRQGSLNFDPKFYLSNNPDVALSYGADNYKGAIEHYLQFGITEQRRGT
jgi:hypothetical protein